MVSRSRRKKPRRRRSQKEAVPAEPKTPEVGHEIELTDEQCGALGEINSKMSSLRSRIGSIEVETMRTKIALLDMLSKLETEFRSTLADYGKEHDVDIDTPGQQWQVQFDKQKLVRTT